MTGSDGVDTPPSDRSIREFCDRVAFDAAGLVPAVAQEQHSGAILMLAWMNRTSLELTLRTGWATYYSRSRGELWVKGETSGHRQRVRRVAQDCDGDAIVLVVEQSGPACHTGNQSFFDALAVDCDRLAQQPGLDGPELDGPRLDRREP